MIPKIASIQVNDITLSYKDWPGERGPLICLPSLSGHKGTFDALAESLSPEYHLLALDLRGRGDSDKPGEGYGFAYHTRDILAFASALGIEKFGIIGHSFGATAGVYLSSIRPLQVRCLVMVDGGADPKKEVMEAVRPTLRHLGTVYPSVEVYLETMREIPYYHPWSETLERYLLEDLERLPGGEVRSKTSPHAIERDLDIQFYYSMCVHFPTMQCPTMFIRPRNGLLGDRAHILDEREAAAFVHWIPKCWRVDLPDVNHYTMLLSDEPLVAPPIKAFLSTIYVSEPAKVEA
jgi:pimeloyl-ACP methyl ester carboxylesterase